MASRAGAMVKGTDGSDYSHRETVVQQYYVSQNGGGPNRRPIRRFGSANINTDPGVYEPADTYKANFTDYPDQEDFLNQLRASHQNVDLTYPVQKELIGMEAVAESELVDGIADCGPPPADSEVQVQDPADLPLANDYQGIGGPNTVPLSTPGAFQRPEVTPHKSCILDELFLAPTQDQLKAYQKVLTKQEIAQTKSRLKWSILFHLSLTVVMLIKLMPEILDKIDVFVLEIEELYLPKPLLWEWIWLLSFPITYMGWSACKKSNASLMNKFITLLFLLGLTPILFGMAYYAADLFQYVSSGTKEDLAEWQGYPIFMLWYGFCLLTLQAHGFELYFAGVLIRAWAPKKKAQ